MKNSHKWMSEVSGNSNGEWLTSTLVLPGDLGAFVTSLSWIIQGRQLHPTTSNQPIHN